jgi:hypothetical protein
VCKEKWFYAICERHLLLLGFMREESFEAIITRKCHVDDARWSILRAASENYLRDVQLCALFCKGGQIWIGLISYQQRSVSGSGC